MFFVRIVTNRCFRRTALISLAVFLAACSSSSDVAEDARVDVDWGDIALSTGPQISWADDVQPVLEKRCVVCHGCFDAPCQLKLTSYEGLVRGANSTKVYDGSRIKAAAPSRLGIDAQTADEWQDMQKAKGASSEDVWLHGSKEKALTSNEKWDPDYIKEREEKVAMVCAMHDLAPVDGVWGIHPGKRDRAP